MPPLEAYSCAPPQPRSPDHPHYIVLYYDRPLSLGFPRHLRHHPRQGASRRFSTGLYGPVAAGAPACPRPRPSLCMPAHLPCCVRRPRSAMCAPPHAQNPPIPLRPASVRGPPPQERQEYKLMARKGRWTTSFTGPPPPAKRRAGQPRLGFGGPAQGVTAVGPRHLPQPHRGGPLPPPRRPPRPHQARLCLLARCAPRALRAARTGGSGSMLTTSFQPPRPPCQAHTPASYSPGPPSLTGLCQHVTGGSPGVTGVSPKCHQNVTKCHQNVTKMSRDVTKCHEVSRGVTKHESVTEWHG